MKIAVRVAVFLFFVTTSLDARASCGEECDDVSAWGKFTSIDIAVTPRKTKDASRWQAQFDHSKGDFRIDVDIAKPNRLGSEIAFFPQSPAFSINPLAKNRIGEDLIVRVDRARVKRAAEGSLSHP